MSTTTQIDWKNWCRLCARNEFHEYETIYELGKLLELSEIMEKLFIITVTSPEDSAIICSDCHSFLNNLNIFTKHCDKVNKMYTELNYDRMNNVDYDLLMIRYRYGVDDEKILSKICINNALAIPKIDQITDTDDLPRDNLIIKLEEHQQNQFYQQYQQQQQHHQPQQQQQHQSQQHQSQQQQQQQMQQQIQQIEHEFMNIEELKDDDDDDDDVVDDNDEKQSEYQQNEKGSEQPQQLQHHDQQQQLKQQQLHQPPMDAISIDDNAKELHSVKYKLRGKKRGRPKKKNLMMMCNDIEQQIINKRDNVGNALIRTNNQYDGDNDDDDDDNNNNNNNNCNDDDMENETDSDYIQDDKCIGNELQELLLNEHGDDDDDENENDDVNDEDDDDDHNGGEDDDDGGGDDGEEDYDEDQDGIGGGGDVDGIVIKQRKRTRRKRTDNEIISCPICEKMFKSRHHYELHMSRSHSKDQYPFVCSKCPKRFTTERKVKLHESVHLPAQLKMIHPCQYCDKKFSKAVNVQSHIRAIHIGDRPFICEECGKSFGTKGALKEHQITHSDERPYQCSHCPKKFKNLPRLRTHEDIHNDTVYVCPHCGLQLNTKRTLKMHMVVHSDQKKYKCHYCGNEYKRSKALKNHLILHTGLRPYLCPFCDKTFANGSNCRSHKKKAHPQELAAMEASGEFHRATNIPKLEHLQPKKRPLHDILMEQQQLQQQQQQQQQQPLHLQQHQLLPSQNESQLLINPNLSQLMEVKTEQNFNDSSNSSVIQHTTIPQQTILNGLIPNQSEQILIPHQQSSAQQHQQQLQSNSNSNNNNNNNNNSIIGTVINDNGLVLQLHIRTPIDHQS